MKAYKTIIISLLLLFLCNTSFGQDTKSTLYISPGCKISWDFKSSIFFTYKISFGKMVSEKNYYNITIGRKVSIKTNSENHRTGYYYLDLQAGSFFGLYPFSAGVGIGAAFFPEPEKFVIHPRATSFIGAGLFGSIDYVFAKNIVDLGLQAVLPIAFYEDYRKFDQ